LAFCGSWAGPFVCTFSNPESSPSNSIQCSAAYLVLAVARKACDNLLLERVD
jgi:hypothetical protein